MALDKFTKLPGDIKDIDFDFRAYLAEFVPADVPAPYNTYTVSGDAGLTLLSSQHANGVVKVWVTGGTSNVTYVVRVVFNTEGGRRKEYACAVKVK